MSSGPATRVAAGVRIIEGVAIALVCGGFAAAAWHGVEFCGGGLRQLYLPEQVRFGDGRVQAYVPNCPGREVHSFAIGVALVLGGALLYWAANKGLRSFKGVSPRRGITPLM